MVSGSFRDSGTTGCEWFSFEIGGRLFHHRLRRDGFVSAASSDGVVTTPPLRGDTPVLNFRGTIEAVIGGQTYRFDGDSVNQSLPPVNGRVIFRLFDGELFSLRGVEPIESPPIPRTLLEFDYRALFDFSNRQSGRRRVTVESAVELVGRPEVSDWSALITQRYRRADGRVERVTLVDRRGEKNPTEAIVEFGAPRGGVTTSARLSRRTRFIGTVENGFDEIYILLMLWFHDPKKWADSEGVEIRLHPIETVEVDCPKIDGYINIHLKDDRFYLVRTDGFYEFDEPNRKFTRTSAKTKVVNKKMLIYYDPYPKKYFRIPIESKELQTVYFHLRKKKMLHGGKKKSFDIRQLKHDGDRYLYRFGDTILEYRNRRWVESPRSRGYHRALGPKIPISDELSEIFGLDLTRYRRTFPGEVHLSDPYEARRHLTEKFGGMLTPLDWVKIQQSDDLRAWSVFAHLADCHREIDHGHLTEMWSPVPLYDSSPSFFYYPESGEYQLYVRANVGPNCRYIQRSTSKDGTSWTPYETVEIPDFSYERGMNYYTPSMFLYHDGRTIVSLNCLVTHPEESSTQTEEQILLTTDGHRFEKLLSREPKLYLDTPELHQITDRLVEIGNTMRFSDDRIDWFAFEGGFFGRVFQRSIRRDGFVSAESERGWLLTRRLRFASTIEVNYRCAVGGSLELRILDRSMETVSSVRLTGDHTRHRIDVPIDTGFLRLVFDRAEIFAVVGADEIVETPIYRSLVYYYRRMYDELNGKYSYGAKKSGWQRIGFDRPVRRLVGCPIIEQLSAVIKQTIEYTDGQTETVTLVDTTVDPSDRISRTKLVPRYFLMSEGAPGAVYGLRLE